jgi:Na+-transporting methylmalonyl-CoA/oxaloacetate decarboxylase gamma subunit
MVVVVVVVLLLLLQCAIRVVSHMHMHVACAVRARVGCPEMGEAAAAVREVQTHHRSRPVHPRSCRIHCSAKPVVSSAPHSARCLPATMAGTLS